MRQTIFQFHRTTTAPPGQFVAGLTDFGPDRSNLFGNSANEYLKVHHVGRSQAEVTEGSHGIWERLHYDWSDPNRVLIDTTDSNVWGGASWYSYIFGRQSDGTTDIDVVVIREGKNLKGRLLALGLSTIGRRTLETAFESSIKAIEARCGRREDRSRVKLTTVTNGEERKGINCESNRTSRRIASQS
jgi:hypothetical protein